jgi:endonuclease/exonuclease/phosphatase family metal-dependent hydrolase
VAAPDTIISYNAQVNRDIGAVVKSLRMMLRDHPHTDVVVLQEAQQYVDFLRKAFVGNWWIYGRKGRAEGLMNPVMVRKAINFPKRKWGPGWGTIANTTDWIGPKHGLKHEGRTWTWVLVGDVYVLSLHRATDGAGQNRKAYLEEAGRLTQFFEKRQGKDIIVFGDTNTGIGADHPGSMQRIREKVHGRLIADEPAGVDYALTTRSITASVERTKTYGSDHKAAVMRGIKVT